MGNQNYWFEKGCEYDRFVEDFSHNHDSDEEGGEE